MITRRSLPAIVMLTLIGPSCVRDQSDDMPLLRIGKQSLTVLTPADDALWEVRDLLAIEGTFWVLTGSAPFVHGFGAQGERIATFGTTGEGPGEFRAPYALWPGESEGTITVWDAGLSVASTLSRTGALVSSRPMPRLGVTRADIGTVTFGDPFRVFRVPGATVLGRYDSGVARANDLWHGKLVRVPEHGRAGEDVIVDFARDLPGAAQRPIQAAVLVPVPLWDGCPDGRIVVLDPVGRTLYLFGPQQAGPDIIALPWRPAGLRPAERLGYIRFQIAAELQNRDVTEAEIDGLAASALAAAEDLFPTEAPIGVDLKCAPGRVWIQEFDGTSHALGYGPVWRTVSVGGEVPQFARIAVPPGFTPYRISASQARGVVTDSLSLQRVATVEFPWRSDDMSPILIPVTTEGSER